MADQLIADGTLTASDYTGPVTSTLADGSKRTDKVYTLRSITVAGRTVTNVPCVVSGPGTSLLLGETFLRRFKDWKVDNQRQVLMLGEAIA